MVNVSFLSPILTQADDALVAQDLSYNQTKPVLFPNGPVGKSIRTGIGPIGHLMSFGGGLWRMNRSPAMDHNNRTVPKVGGNYKKINI